MASESGAVTLRSLRVALVWNGTLQAEETLDQPQQITLGSVPGALFPLPDDGGGASTSGVTLLEPGPSGWQLRLAPGMGGVVWSQGDRRRVRDIAAAGSLVTQPVGPDDYGVVTLGTIAVFFQSVKAARTPARQALNMDGATFASFGLSVFLHAAAIILLLLARREMPDPDPLELPTDLIRRFMVTPPPEDILEQARESGTNTEDPGLHDREEGGAKAAGDEGRVGREDSTQEQTEIQGEHTGEVAAKVRKMGLLGVLSGGGATHNPITDTLNDLPTVGDMLSGLNSTRTVMGHGSGGMGLRGGGTGGGGTGPGVLFGAGGVGTGVGAGHGNGLGRGGGGIGVKGRPHGEIAVSLQQGTPRVNGYLSAEQINRVVRANSAAIRYCYELEVQRQPNLRGRIEIQWRINLGGEVTTARVETSSMHNAGVEGCIVRQVRRWRFDHPDGGEVVVSYPFIFGVQG